MLKLALVRKAIKLFPMSEFTTKEAVKHARSQWIKAQYYLHENKISIKPLYRTLGN